MTKKIKRTLKVTPRGGTASPAPPLGPALGQHGVNIMDFVNQYNKATEDKKGQIVPAVITIYEDRSFDFELKLPPMSSMIKKELGIDKGSSEPNKDKVGKLTQAQLEKIAKEKMPDLNATTLEAAKNIVKGSARSMGVEIEN